jgi:hypothetical protein
MTEQRPISDNSYRKYLTEEKLMGSRCTACGALYMPPRAICVSCYKSDMEWVEMTGQAKLSAFTCIAVGPPAMIAEGYGRNNPYCSGVVELEGNLRVDARIVGVDTQNPETIKVGMALRPDFLHTEKDGVRTTRLAFRPA